MPPKRITLAGNGSPLAFGGRDCLVRYKLGGKTIAAASIYRDVASLKEEVAMEHAAAVG